MSFINGQGVSNQLGGGFIGGLLYTLNHYLFSTAGSKIVAVFSMFIGITFMTNLSLGNFYMKCKQWSGKLIHKFSERRKRWKEQKRK